MKIKIKRSKGNLLVKCCVILLSALLLLSGCGRAERTPAMEPKSGSSPASETIPPPSSSKTEPEESPAPETPSSGEESASDPEPQPGSRTGRILAMGNALLDFPGESKAGTQAELDLWEAAVNDPALARIDFSNRHDTERELSAEEEQKILTALRDADLRLYDSLPNPSTGGGCQVIAYDGRENIVFHANFMGDWFCVRFGDEDIKYVFDGEGTTLNDLFGIS